MKTAGREEAPFELRVRSAGGRADAAGRRRDRRLRHLRARRTRWAPTACRRSARRRAADRDLLRHPRRARRASARATPAGACWWSAAATRRSTRCSTWPSWRSGAGDRDHLGGARRADVGADVRRRRRRRAAGARRARRAPARAGGLGRGAAGRPASRSAELRAERDGVTVVDARPAARCGPFDEIMAATGFRPDLAMLRELRLDARPGRREPARAGAADRPQRALAAARCRRTARASCAHPEPGFYVVGMKSYGRAPTFLMLTGYEQVRSVVAALAGDLEAAAARGADAAGDRRLLGDAGGRRRGRVLHRHARRRRGRRVLRGLAERAGRRRLLRAGARRDRERLLRAGADGGDDAGAPGGAPASSPPERSRTSSRRSTARRRCA